jgi:dTDP-4-amino-4,6-dideoxygalactose transaminase
MSDVKTIPLAFIDLVAQQARIKPQIEQAIATVLAHGAYIMGPEVRALEEMLCNFTGAKHAITCASGTDALLMGLMAYGVGPGDAVLVPSFTFPATPEVIALLGATPVFVDVLPESFNICCNSVSQGIALAKGQGLKVKGIIAVDLYGQPADYPALQVLADANDLWLMADAAQSFGASLADKRVGTLAHITATSFFPAKPLGCYGDGGCVFTDDDELASLLRSIRVHGKGEHKYDNVRVGINGRLDTIQAAILLEKLKIYPDELEARENVAATYRRLFADIAVTCPVLPQNMTSAWAQYTLTLPEGCDRDALQQQMKANGVPTMVYYPKPLHKQRAYSDCLCVPDLSVSDSLSTMVLSLPMHPYLTVTQQQFIIDNLSACLI